MLRVLRFVYQQGTAAEHHEEKVHQKCNSIRRAVNSFSAALKLGSTQGFILLCFHIWFRGLLKRLGQHFLCLYTTYAGVV